MSRWIDADAIKEKIDNIWNGRPLSVLGAKILAMIDDAPSIDIVRCRECKYTDGEPPIADGRSWCRQHYSYMYYCSDGERSE